MIAIEKYLFFYLSGLSDDFAGGLIFSDSISALEAIQKGETNSSQDINSLFRQIIKPCMFQWIPAHVDIEGNERGDIPAKETEFESASHRQF